MYQLLIKSMLIAALYQLGISVSEFSNCSNRQCLQHIEKASRNILRIDWKPISIFPNEAKRFK